MLARSVLSFRPCGACKLVRGIVTLRPEAPVYFAPQEDGLVRVSFSQREDATPVGTFPKSMLPEFTKAFETDPSMLDSPAPILANPSAFDGNRAFWPRASQILAQNIHKCPIFRSIAAAETKTQFLHIYDLRNPPPLGRIPEVEDILGTVRIENCEIIENSFDANMMYRVVSSYGLMRLSPEMTALIAKLV